MLPGGKWELIFDEEGFRALVHTSADIEPILVEDFLHYQVYVTREGDLASEGQCKGSMVNLTNVMQKYLETTIDLEVGPSLACRTFACVQLRWPHFPAARIMWNCK